MSDGEIKVSFGDGCDGATFDNVFGHLADGHYVVAVNKVDLQIEDIRDTKGRTGLLGVPWDDELGEARGPERFFPWERLRSVHIY